jgi:2-keto-3-deoxy-L-fuconate dehydrogenase
MIGIRTIVIDYSEDTALLKRVNTPSRPSRAVASKAGLKITWMSKIWRPKMQDEFAGRIAIVTGGGAGLGKAAATALLQRGGCVAILDRDISGAPAGAEALQVDVRSDDEVRRAINRFGQMNGCIDFLVNNAGISYPATVEDGPLDDWHRVFDINVLGYVRATRAALPFLRKSRHASIVNMSSCTAATGLRRRVLYSATKGAIEAMTRAMAADLIHEGIRVNCVNPGTVDTPLIEALIRTAPDPEAQRQVYNERQPTGFMVSADEVARAVLYLLSPAARSTVGSVLTVDGGLSSVRLFSS